MNVYANDVQGREYGNLTCFAGRLQGSGEPKRRTPKHHEGPTYTTGDKKQVPQLVQSSHH